MKREYVATLFLTDGDLVYLIYHKKLKSYLPPGGHLEEGELPHEAALRECFEETGYRAEIVDMAFCETNAEKSRSIPSPLQLSLDSIPEYEGEPEHEHIDFIYLGRPLSREGEGSETGKWFKSREILEMPENMIFLDVKQIVRALYTDPALL